MLRHVLFDLHLFDNEAERESSQKGLLWLLEGLTQWNQLYLRNHPETPTLYKSGVKYGIPEQFKTGDVEQIEILKSVIDRKKLKDKKVKAALEDIRNMIGGEKFRDIPRIIEAGIVDCDNLACWRTAELRESGIAAMPYITWRKRLDGGMTYHALVLWPDGGTEDPSLLLGMGGAKREADRQIEREKLAERAYNIAQKFIEGSGTQTTNPMNSFSSGSVEIADLLLGHFANKVRGF